MGKSASVSGLIACRLRKCGRVLPSCSPHSTKERTVAFLLERFHSLLREGDTSLLESIETRLQINERERQAKRFRKSFKQAPTCWNDLSANAVAGNETYVKSVDIDADT